MDIVNPILVKNKKEQSKTVALSMGAGDQTIIPDAGKVLSSVTVEKPATLISANIKSGVDIGGVIGDFAVPLEAQKTVALDMASGDQVITPTSGYDGLQEVVVEKPATLISSNIKDGVTIGGVVGTFAGAPANNFDELIDGSITSLVVPEGKTKIKKYLCYQLTGLTSLTLSSTITEIEQYAFYGCTGLTTLTIPNSVITIGEYAFYGCSYLTSISLGSGLTSIGNYAFNGCSRVSSDVQLPSNVKEIGNYAFENFPSNRVKGTITNPTRIGSYAFNWASGDIELIMNESGTPISIGSTAFDHGGCKKITGKWLSIGVNAFHLSGIKYVDIECTSLGSNAFSENGTPNKLHLVVNGAIGTYALQYNQGAKDVHISGRVTSVGNFCFRLFGTSRSGASGDIHVIDFSQGTFTSLGSEVFGGSSEGVKFTIIRLPSTLTSCTSGYTFGSVKNSWIFFSGTTPPTVQSTTFFNNTNDHYYVPYDYVNTYRTTANWNTISSQIYGYAAPNTFQDGDTLPTVNAEGYALTWYSDMRTTAGNEITTIADASQEVYCVVATTL